MLDFQEIQDAMRWDLNTSEFPVLETFFKAVAQLPDEELDALEDEINFFAFTGIQGKRVQSLIAEAAN